MNLCPLLESQVRIQAEAIVLWKRWMVGLVLCGFVILAGAEFKLFPGGGLSGSGVIQIGGLFISLLGVFPYREIVPRKERLATYSFRPQRFRLYDQLCIEDRNKLLIFG